MNRNNNICFEIKTVSNLIRRRINNSQTKKYADNLTGMHGWIIDYLINNQDRDIFQKDFEKDFSIRRSSVTSILKLMEKNGLIERKSVEYDARLKKIILTQRAYEIHDMINRDIDKIDALIKTGLSDDEITSFFGIIEKIKANLE